ncbi:MAG: hypothetical protein ABFC96_03520 [Thermoguttaceae bacterium]
MVSTMGLRRLQCVLAVAFLVSATSIDVGLAADNPASKVDFSYAFAAPHRITVARPDSSDKTLLDLQPGSLRMSWSYENLAMANYPPLALRTPGANWAIQIAPQIDGKPVAKSRWTRLDGVLPALDNTYEDALGSVRLEVAGGLTAALVRIEVVNTDSKPHRFTVQCDSLSWGESPAWIDPTQYAGDHLLAGWNERADRVLVLGLGADAYSLRADGVPPGKANMILVWNLKPGEKCRGWIVRPYRGYTADLPTLRKHDWAKEWEEGKKEWHDLLGRASKLSIPDTGVTNAYYACLADLFIMREPSSDRGRIIAVPGTEGYRAGNSAEPSIVAIALDQNGLHKEAAEQQLVTIGMQEADGNWSDARGWGHSWWGAPGFKSWAIMEHYRLTGDKQFLADAYPHMAASSRWQEKQRARSRTEAGRAAGTYGLMPRGFGDCGLDNAGDAYGVFFPHNIWSVYGDRCSSEAAEILGKTDDAAELQKIYETARRDLLTAIDRGAIKEKDYRWVSGIAGNPCGSRWGALNVTVPCGLLPPDHELVTGTLGQIESNISKGGQPLHTGWMADGAWVAITLDNIAETHLARGNGDVVARYFYSTLNHATPLYTWCEERGQEPGTTKQSGDRQHLWTPVAVVRCLRDMMVLEKDDGLELALGTAREWLASGKPVGIAGAATHFGKVSYRMRYDAAGSTVTGEATFAEGSTAKFAALQIRLPDGLKVKSVDPASKAVVLPGGAGIRWTAPRGTIHFEAAVGR